MSEAALVSVSMNLLAILPMFIAFMFVQNRHRPFLVTICGSYAVFYWMRSLMLTLGLDTSALDPLAIDPRGIDGANLRLAVWSSLAMLSFVAFQNVAVRPSVGGLPKRRYDFVQLRRLALYASIGATMCFGVIVAKVGSPIAAIEAAKAEKAVAGLYLLQFGPVAAMVLCLAAALAGKREGHRLILRMPFLVLGLLNALYVFAWGSRRVVVIYLAGLMLEPVFTAVGNRRERGANSSPRDLRRWVGIALIGVAVIGSALGLRVARDHVLQGRTSDAIADASPLRSVSVAMNATVYDSYVLAVRDTPDTFEFSGSELFINGTGGVVPRAVWADKPTNIAPGAAFRQQYEPEVKNGWPVGAVGEWWLSFGWFGIVLGGLLSGVCYAAVSQALGDLRKNPLAHALSVGIVFQVLELGLNVQSLVRWIGWCGSVLVALAIVSKLAPPANPWGPAGTQSKPANPENKQLVHQS